MRRRQQPGKADGCETAAFGERTARQQRREHIRDADADIHEGLGRRVQSIAVREIGENAEHGGCNNRPCHE